MRGDRNESENRSENPGPRLITSGSGDDDRPPPMKENPGGFTTTSTAGRFSKGEHRRGTGDVTADSSADLLDAEFTPGPDCRPFDRHAFQMRLCPPADGLRARWVGRRWVTDPAGKDVLVRVTVMEMQSGEVYVTVVRSEPGAAPFVVRLLAVNPASGRVHHRTR